MGASAAPIFGVSAGLQLAGGVYSALAADAAGVYNEAMSEYDAKQLDDQAVDAIARGEDAAQQVGQQGRRVLGTQRAALAGQGIDLSVGTAVDLQAETQEMTARDLRTVRLNAMEEGRGIRAAAATTRAQGRMGGRAARSQAVGTLLTGGAGAISAAAQGYESYRAANPRTA